MATVGLWADRYRPTSVAQMCAPDGANRLRTWLINYPTGSSPRAALLSGGPGIGKTTSAHLVAEELGYSVVEYNASDHRSAKTLSEGVSDVTDNRSLDGFFNLSAKAPPVPTNGRFILLMDEVDGCDRGGVTEIIAMIKKTKVPIVCTCNDRFHPKLKSLLNHVEDIRFKRPQYTAVAAWIRDRVLAKEGISISQPVLQEAVQKEGNDIRSLLNNLQLWCLNQRNLSDQQVSRLSASGQKNLDVGLFSAAEQFFLEKKSFEELQQAFYENDMMDMFIQENYLHFKPASGQDWLKMVAFAASDIARGDVLSQKIFTEQTWAISNHRMLMSAISPSKRVFGKYQSFLPPNQSFYDSPVKFPAWFGNNSTTGKNKRILGSLAKQASPTGTLGANPDVLAVDYMHVLRAALTDPLVLYEKDGITKVTEVMEAYKLTRDDWDFVQDVCTYKKLLSRPVPLGTGTIPTAVKSAFTREFNKTHRLEGISSVLRSCGAPLETQNDDEVGDDDEEDDDEAFSKKRPRLVQVGPGAPKPASKAKKATAPKPKNAAPKPARKNAKK